MKLLLSVLPDYVEKRLMKSVPVWLRDIYSGAAATVQGVVGVRTPTKIQVRVSHTPKFWSIL